MTSLNNNRFYVYVHRRKTDNSIFYVGKGTGYRYKRTKVKCTTYDIVFLSIKCAVHWLTVVFNKPNASHSKIIKCCNDAKYSYYGMKWEYVQ